MSSLSISDVFAKCTLSSPVPWASISLPFKLARLIHRRGILITIGIVLRAAHIAFGVNRVVEPPVADRRNRNARP